ncbi:MAG: hypothetical protein K0S37_1329 [Microbacterium sp.]|jgi:hypothetical protein|nr:hypothetical protein [Microbacterium sp.]
MATVTVEGSVLTHEGVVFPLELSPELWFRPQRPSSVPGALLVGVEVKAEWVNINEGLFTVRLEAAPDTFYVPVFRWRQNPAEPRPELWSYGYQEWPYKLWPGNGGAIDDLLEMDLFTNAWILSGFGDPTGSVLGGNRPYFDISGDTLVLWGPESAVA